MRLSLHPKIRLYVIMVFVCAVSVPVLISNAYGAAAVEGQRRAQQQRQAQQEAMQRRAYQDALRQQMMQKELIDQQQQQQIAAYQKQLSQKQKIMYQEAVKREIAQQRLASGSVPAPLQETNGVLVAGSSRGSGVSGMKGRPDEVVDIYDLWDEFEHTSEAWPMMMDRQPKRLTVQKYIDYFQKQGVYIRKPADHYVDMIDSMSQGNPKMLEQPFDRVMQFVTIMEYDFDNGTNRDELARRVLGEQFYQQNKQRLGR